MSKTQRKKSSSWKYENIVDIFIGAQVRGVKDLRRTAEIVGGENVFLDAANLVEEAIELIDCGNPRVLFTAAFMAGQAQQRANDMPLVHHGKVKIKADQKILNAKMAAKKERWTYYASVVLKLMASDPSLGKMESYRVAADLICADVRAGKLPSQYQTEEKTVGKAYRKYEKECMKG